MKTLLLILFTSAIVLFGAEVSIRLPVGCVVTDNDNSGKTWAQSGFINVTYVTALNNFTSSLRSQGWREIQHIEMGKEKLQSIMLWQRGNDKLTLMLWKVQVAQTGFSWGIAK